MNQKISVLVVSENRLIRESLSRILSKRSDLEVESSHGCSNARDEAMARGAHILILDSPECLFLLEGWERPQLDTDNPVKILLVCMEDDEQLFLRAIRAGVLGFIPKDASALDVVAAVRSLARGEGVCPPRFCKFLFDLVATQIGESRSSEKLRSSLTRREQQLVPMIGRGLTNKEIASQLNLSEQTVKNHVHRILHKVGVGNRLSILGAIEPRNLLN